MRAWGGQECPKKYHTNFIVIFLITREKIGLPVRIMNKNFTTTRPTSQACQLEEPDGQCFLLKTWFGKQREGEEEGGWTSSARESSLGSTGGSGGMIYGRN